MTDAKRKGKEKLVHLDRQEVSRWMEQNDPDSEMRNTTTATEKTLRGENLTKTTYQKRRDKQKIKIDDNSENEI